MLLPSDQPAFGITHPLGLPRPLDPDNFFGAKRQFFVSNQMPIPSGCLAHFDLAVYRPYLKSILAFLEGVEYGWNGVALADDPPRYCLLKHETPAQVPDQFWPFLPEPPQVPLQAILAHLGLRHAEESPMELLDVLTLVSEDLGSARFAAATAGHPWVSA
jgi:hypothetical protein